VCKRGQRSWELSGSQPETTNNQMELMAVLRAVESLEESSAIALFTDSQLAIGWLSEGWKRRDPECRVLCERIERATARGGHTLKLQKVAGHTGDTLNERAHRLAQSAIRNQQSKI